MTAITGVLTVNNGRSDLPGSEALGWNTKEEWDRSIVRQPSIKRTDWKSRRLEMPLITGDQ
jgi:hypothetical protein